MMLVAYNVGSITVSSFTNGDLEYVVNFDEQHNSLQSCTCPDYSRNAPIICKHMFLVHRVERISLPYSSQPENHDVSHNINTSQPEVPNNEVPRPDPEELYLEAVERYAIKYNRNTFFF